MFVKFNDRRSTVINMSLVRSFNKADELSPISTVSSKDVYEHCIVIRYTDGEIETLSYASMIERDSDYSDQIRTINWLDNYKAGN